VDASANHHGRKRDGLSATPRGKEGGRNRRARRNRRTRITLKDGAELYAPGDGIGPDEFEIAPKRNVELTLIAVVQLIRIGDFAGHVDRPVGGPSADERAATRQTDGGIELDTAVIATRLRMVRAGGIQDQRLPGFCR